MENKIQIRGCSENNFKNIDLDISKNKVVVFLLVRDPGMSEK